MKHVLNVLLKYALAIFLNSSLIPKDTILICGKLRHVTLVFLQRFKLVERFILVELLKIHFNPKKKKNL